MNFLYFLYYSLPNFAPLGFIGKIINKILGRIFSMVLNFAVPQYLKRTSNKVGFGLNTEPRSEEYIVSLTSFPTRIEKIWISIECILRQTFKPDKVILWLADDQFPDRELPKELLDLQKRGLSIEFCDDIKSHKKYFYSILKNPKANIITLDDDIYYDNSILLNLYNLHLMYPSQIVSNRVHKITFTKTGDIKPYREWKHNAVDSKPSHLLFHTSGAGVLFPTKSLPNVAFNKELFMKLSPKSDDVWLKCMAIIQDTKIVTNNKYNKDPIVVNETQNESLVSHNTMKGGKDIQLKSVISHFGIDISNYL